jgi:hypothetical protein
MEPLRIKITNSTPSIYLNNVTGNFVMTGRSFPEEAIKFYQPVIEWIKGYAEEPNENTKFTFKFEYINSASCRALCTIMEILEELFLKGKNVEVEWKYNIEDNELKEAGNELSEIYKMPFKLEGYMLS